MFIPDVFNDDGITVVGTGGGGATGLDGKEIEGNEVDGRGFCLFRDRYGTGESGGLNSSSDVSLSFPKVK